MRPSGTDHPTSEQHELPDVDQRLVAPETRYEIHEGRVVYVAPADEPHGTRHSKIATLLEIHAKDEFDVAVDMLTRTSVLDDMAPDVSVFARARHPKTGARQIEQLAFEVASTERLWRSRPKRSSSSVAACGGCSPSTWCTSEPWSGRGPPGAGEFLARDGVIEDETLAAPLPVAALVDAVKADDAVARALLVKRNPVIEEALRGESRRRRRAGPSRGQGRGDSWPSCTPAGSRCPTRWRSVSRRPGYPALLESWLLRAATCTDVDWLG